MLIFLILICYALQRYWCLDNKKLSPVFDDYAEKCILFFSKLGVKQAYVLVFLLVLPILLMTWLLSGMFYGVWLGLFSFLLNIVVLFLCLSFYNPRVPLACYFQALKHNDTQAAYRYGAIYLGETHPNDLVKIARAITRKIFLDAGRHIYSVIFWYILLGKTGAIVYSVVSALGAKRHVKDEAISKAAQIIHAALDWIPARIVGLSYLLVGHIAYGFEYWQNHFFDGLMPDKAFAYGTGLAALEKDTDNAVSAGAEENEDALLMVKRALVLWLVVIAVFTLISWIA